MVFIYMGKFILQESEKEQIRRMYGLVNEQTKSPEDNQEFLDWVKNATVMPFIAPNPYSNGDLKLGTPNIVSKSAGLNKLLALFLLAIFAAFGVKQIRNFAGSRPGTGSGFDPDSIQASFLIKILLLFFKRKRYLYSM